MKPGEKCVIESTEEKNIKSYVDINKSGLAVVIIYDHEYPLSAILAIKREIVDSFYKICNDEKFDSIKSKLIILCLEF
jgi:hypothetical protein